MGHDDNRCVYFYRILAIADLTVEGSITLGAAIAAQAITIGLNPYIATGISL